jgi:hypothetical protein
VGDSRVEEATQVETPASLRDHARDLLADGQWHDLEVILREMGKFIPPGQAVREMERSRRKSARHRGLEVKPRTFHRSPEREVESGRRRLALEALRHGHFEVDPPSSGGNRRVVGRKVRFVRE